MKFSTFIVAITMMSMIGIFSSDVYLPSMPAMSLYFGANIGTIQRTMSIYLVGLAIFQLIYGPVSDHFGRRKTLLAGLIVYIFASLGCVFAGEVSVLLIFRFLQAIGACAGLVMGRCIVADIYSDKREATRIFSIVLPVVAMSPAIAPVIGGYVQEWLNWRYVMGLTVIFGSVLFLIVYFSINETLFKFNSDKFRIRCLVKKNLNLLGNREFLIYTLIIACVYLNWFSYLAESSYIYKGFGLTASLIGYCYMSQSFSSVLGSLTLNKFLLKFEINFVIFFSLIFNLIACLALLFVGSHSLWVFMGLITLTAFSNGILLPANISLAMGSISTFDKNLAGTGSGLIGFFQIGSAAVGTFVMSVLPHGVFYLSVLLVLSMFLALWRLNYVKFF